MKVVFNSFRIGFLIYLIKVSRFYDCRQNEIQRLKEALILQNQKRDDLNNYKQYVHTEYQENTVRTILYTYLLSYITTTGTCYYIPIKILQELNKKVNKRSPISTTAIPFQANLQ